MKRLSILVLLVMVFPLFAATTNPPPLPSAGETIEVSIVNLDVIVTDRKGHRVHGLTKDDFQILEDGKPQPISNFAAYMPESTVIDGKVAYTAPAAAEAPKRQHRTIVVFVDQFRLPPFRVDPIFTALKKTLHSVVGPGDAVLIAKWNLRTIIRLDFTDDLAAIDRTLDGIAHDCTGADFDPLTVHRREAEQMEDWFAAIAAAAAEKGMTVPGGEAQWISDMNAADYGRRQLDLMREKTEALNSFISTMSNDDGRKALIFLSNHFSRYAGAEYLFATNPGKPLDPNQRGQFGTYNLLEILKATANAHGVTVYAMYPPGLGNTLDSDPQLIHYPAPYAAALNHQVLDNELANLDDLSKSTGGTMAWGSVNIADALPSVRDDFEDYYSMAYRVAARNDDRSRSVIVKAKNRDYIVRSRRQYMEKSDENRIRDQVVASLFRPHAPTGMFVDASLGKTVPKDNKHFSVPISIRIPAASFMTTQDGVASKGAFSVYVATGRVIGETSEISKKTIPFTVGDVEKAKDGYFTYDFELVTDLNTNRVAVGVYDEVSHETGFARLDLYTIKD
jgi:VWFA-related protein